MRKMGLGFVTVITAIAFSTLVFAKMGDEEWGSARPSLAAQAGSKDSAQRVQAAQGLGQADRKEACEILLGMIAVTSKIKEPLVKDHADLSEQLEKIGIGPNTGSVPKSALVAEVALKMRDVEKQIQAEDDVRDACIEALAKTKDEEAVKWLASVAPKSTVPSDRAAVAEVMGINKWPGAGQALEDMFAKEKESLVKLAICEAFLRCGDKESVDTLGKALLDQAWQVRLSAIAALRKIGGPEPVGPLIEAFDKEKELRVKTEFAATLKTLTGMDYNKDTATWKKWWADNVATFKGPAPKPAGEPGAAPAAGATAAFFGIPIDSDKVVFILDISGSMNEMTKNESKEGEKTISSGPGERKNKKEDEDLMTGEHPKIDVAKFELKKCIKKLKKEVKFNIYFFNDGWTKWQESLVPADAKWREEAFSYIDSQSANGQTNLWDPMEDALKSAGMGLNDKHYKSALDTIFVLSDGSPYPDDVYVNAADIPKRLQDMNSLKKVKIHVIGIGTGQNTQLLGAIARITGGIYTKR